MMMLLHPVIFYNGTCAAPGRRWREHTAVIPQVVRENSARQVDLVPGKTRLLLLLLNPTPSASSFCRQQVVELEHLPEYEFGLHQSLSHHLLSAHANITLHLICLSGLC